MAFQPGDIQLLNNHTVVHWRTGVHRLGGAGAQAPPLPPLDQPARRAARGSGFPSRLHHRLQRRPAGDRMSDAKLTAVVTGGSNGIGEGICAMFLAHGDTRSSTSTCSAPQQRGERPATATSRWTSSMRRPREARGDRSPATSRSTASSTTRARPRRAILEDVTSAHLDIGVNLSIRTPILLAQAFVPGMKARRFGRIVNISSRAILGKKARTVYSATKAAMVGLTRTWALELGPHGITVNAIAPGPVLTELFKKNNPPEVAAKLVEHAIVGTGGHSGGRRARGAVPGRSRERIHHRAGAARLWRLQPHPQLVTQGRIRMKTFSALAAARRHALSWARRTRSSPTSRSGSSWPTRRAARRTWPRGSSRRRCPTSSSSRSSSRTSRAPTATSAPTGCATSRPTATR